MTSVYTRVPGGHPLLTGEIREDLCGDVTDLRGHVTCLRGDVSDLRGD